MKSLIVCCAILLFSSLAFTQQMRVHNGTNVSTFEITQIDSITFSTSAQPFSGISWWPLNEGAGTTVYDHWGNNDGTLGVNVSWVPGGVQLSATPSAVNMTDSVFRLPEGAWQVTINTDSGQSGGGWIVAKDGFGFNDDGIFWVGLDGFLHFDIQAVDGSITHNINSDRIIPFGVDVVVTAEWGSQGMKIWINDLLVGTNGYTGPIFSPGRPLSLGLNQGDNVSFTGKIMDVKVFDAYIK
jgi:hypothetical protein